MKQIRNLCFLSVSLLSSHEVESNSELKLRHVRCCFNLSASLTAGIVYNRKFISVYCLAADDCINKIQIFVLYIGLNLFN